MMRNKTETELADLRLVERWLYQQGDVPSYEAIANAVTACMLDWARAQEEGMYTLADTFIDRAQDIVTTARGM